MIRYIPETDEVVISIFEYEYLYRIGKYVDEKYRYARCKGCGQTFSNIDRYFHVNLGELTNICLECFPTYYTIENVAKRRSEIYVKNNKNRQHSQNRRTRQKALLSDLTFEQWLDSLEYFNNECAYCGYDDDDLEQEHVKPLSKGGEYTKSNIIPACKRCNTSKSNRNLNDWYKKQEFYNEEKLEKILDWIHQYTVINKRLNHLHVFSYTKDKTF